MEADTIFNIFKEKILDDFSLYGPSGEQHLKKGCLQSRGHISV